MSYDDFEYSVEDGAPIELYAFECEGGALNFYYTNNEEAISFGGKTYLPLHIERELIDISAIIAEPATIDFVVPYECDLGEWYGKPFAPPMLFVRVWRKHDGDNNYKKLYLGTSDNFVIEDDLLRIETKPYIQSLVHRVMCANRYHNRCNNYLFDARCKVNKADYTWTTTVTAINDQFITVADDQNADDFLQFGDMIINGEYRMILSNASNVIKVRYPYTVIEVGMEVTLVAGCKRTKEACIGFDNLPNYGGFPLTPKTNPIKTATKPGVFTKPKPMKPNGGIHDSR